MEDLIYATVHFEYGQLIRCDIGPRTVERSRDDQTLLYKTHRT
jgi:hypothetical protein